MTIATVKLFNASKGFGPIQAEAGDEDVSVQMSAVDSAGMDTLQEGQRLQYGVVMDHGKQAAGNLVAV